MSWLTAAISKVQEHARAGFSRRQQGTVGQEQRFAEIGIDQERKANAALTSAAVTGPAELEEVIRTWVRQLESGAVDVNRQRDASNFRQALLRSRAIEITFEAISLDNTLRRHYSQPQTWKTFGIRGLMGQVYDCSEDVWSPIIRLLWSEEELLSQRHVTFLVEALSAVKADWGDEELRAERRELTMRVEYLLQELRVLDDTGVGERKDAARHTRRLEISAEVFEVYRALRENVEEASGRLQSQDRAREMELNRIDEHLQAYGNTLADPEGGVDARSQHLQQDLLESHEHVQAELQLIDREREAMDREIEALDARKQELRMQLDGVGAGLHEVQAEQRRHMKCCDEQHAALHAIEAEFRSRIRSEDDAIQEAQAQTKAVQRTLHLVGEIESVIDHSVNSQLEDLAGKQAQFDVHFIEILQEHLDLEEQHQWQLQKEVEACVQLVARHRSQIEMLNVMDMSTRSVVSPEEQRRFERVIDAADTAQRELEAFLAVYGEFIVGTQAEALARELIERHKVLQQVLLSCRDLAPTRAHNGAATPPTVVPSRRSLTPPPPKPTTTVCPASAVPSAITTSPALTPRRAAAAAAAAAASATSTTRASSTGTYSVAPSQPSTRQASQQPPLPPPPHGQGAQFQPMSRVTVGTSPRLAAPGGMTPLARGGSTPPMPPPHHGDATPPLPPWHGGAMPSASDV
eukprot:TRINITY_DN10115_c0_g1_i1.p1 TRINITY_DN10115_c0_g1~~TRINITY_DN10115_c0_g1_i1.p1  ORF type:complete len:691 (-),score=134.32 TRINITY_DN10115_c0_g1_i1:66-2138(-)